MPTPTANYEIPAEMRELAEKSVDQARKAVDGFLGAAQKTFETLEGSADAMQASAKDASRKALSYTEQNLSATFDFAQRLVRAKDVQEAVQLQAEFARSQFAALQNQMKDFGSMAQSAMSQGVRTAQDAASEGMRRAREATEQATQGAGRAAGTQPRK